MFTFWLLLLIFKYFNQFPWNSTIRDTYLLCWIRSILLRMKHFLFHAGLKILCLLHQLEFFNYPGVLNIKLFYEEDWGKFLSPYWNLEVCIPKAGIQISFSFNTSESFCRFSISWQRWLRFICLLSMLTNSGPILFFAGGGEWGAALEKVFLRNGIEVKFRFPLFILFHI